MPKKQQKKMKENSFNEIVLAIKDTIKGTEWENRVMLVGGCVRDLLMGNNPNDIDLLIDGDINAGIDFANFMGKGHTVVVYPTYGTAMFHFMGEKIECVAPRKEKYKSDSRNPIVESATLKEECLRRDFTINSMYINVSTNETIDETGLGKKDIENHVIRSTSRPDIIFSDDPLRMLRAIRFSSRFGWKIEKETYDGILKNAKRIEIITQERITDEINKILLSNNPSMGLQLIYDTGLMQYILPEFMNIINMKQNKYHFGTVWEHTLSVVENTESILENRLAALFHDLGKYKSISTDENGNVHFYKHELFSADLTEEILKRMKYSNNTIKCVKKAVIEHMRTKSFGDTCENVKDKTIRKLQYDLGSYKDLCLDVINADNLSHAKDYCMPNQVRIIKEKFQHMDKNGLGCQKIVLPVNGNDIMSTCNLKPSELVKKALEWLKSQYINDPNKYKNKGECLKAVKSYLNNFQTK